MGLLSSVCSRKARILRSETSRYELLIFLTGAVTLALEVLASRIMTPYFGVSLYIWSGILSITLVFLAIGYHVGGKLSQRWSREQAEYAFLAAPIVSAFFITVSTFLYPVLFPWLSQGNLIAGSFIGASILLALPLIALSAMNPLLISLQSREEITGDSGAGRVFFISTMGSVTGVLMTAFLFIPNVTNFRGTLILCVCASLASLYVTFRAQDLDRKRRNVLVMAGVISVTVSVLSFMGKETYLRLITEQPTASSQHRTYRVLAEYTSMFGNLKVAEVTHNDASSLVEKHLIHDGLIQNRTRLDHSSLSTYTDVLEDLVHLYTPEAKDVLVLGLGAGIVPRRLSAQGKTVSVVEINPVTVTAAREHFGFSDEKIEMHIEDARTFARACRNRFDALIVDLFLGDNVPDYLTTQEFFRDLRTCLRPDGVLVMNAFFDSENALPNGRLLSTIGTAFADLSVSGASSGNVYIVASTGKTYSHWNDDAYDPIRDLSFFSSRVSQRIDPSLYQSLEPITDEHNIFSLLFSDANIAMRQYLAGDVPRQILVN